MMGCDKRSMSSAPESDKASSASNSDGVTSESTPMGGNAPAAPPAVMQPPQAMATAAAPAAPMAPGAAAATGGKAFAQSDESAANGFGDDPLAPRKSGLIGGMGGGGANAKVGTVSARDEAEHGSAGQRGGPWSA